MSRFIILLLIFLASGCASDRPLTIRELKENQPISKIILDNGREVDFSRDPAGSAFCRNYRIERFDDSGRITYYELRDIKILYCREGEIKDNSPAYWILFALSIPILALVVLFSRLGPLG